MNTCILRKTKGGRETCQGILANINRKDVQCARSREKNESDILIRWGSTANFNCRYEINTPEMIHLMSDKIETRRKLIDAGIAVPKTYFRKQDILNARNVKYPLIGRRRQHAQGLEMTICRTPN